jgi:hypothetical protein
MPPFVYLTPNMFDRVRYILHGVFIIIIIISSCLPSSTFFKDLFIRLFSTPLFTHTLVVVFAHHWCCSCPETVLDVRNVFLNALMMNRVPSLTRSSTQNKRSEPVTSDSCSISAIKWNQCECCWASYSRAVVS